MKVRKMKKIVCTFVMCVILLSSTVATQAAQVADIQAELQSCAEEMNISTKEIIDFKENLYDALDEINSGVVDAKAGITTVKISENLYFEVEPVLSVESARATQTTLTNKAYVKNSLGQTLITLTIVGTFLRSGTTVTPQNVYGLYNSSFYSVDCSQTHLGGPATVGTATVIYKCEFNIGIGDWVIPFFSANIGGTLYCDYNGNPSSTWSGL